MREIKRLPRKLKKLLKKQGINPKEFLERLQLEEERGHYIDKIFNRDYENAHKIVQKIIEEGK